MKVRSISGEPTRVMVEGNSLNCDKCEKQIALKVKKYEHLTAGDQCPKCDAGVLEYRWHTVDIAKKKTNGECSCEHFTFTLDTLYLSFTEEQRWALLQQNPNTFRCGHIIWAREFILNASILNHDREQSAGRKHD